MIVGDSIAWGQGLNKDEKTAALLSNAYKLNDEPTPSEISLAHSGAIIGTPSPKSLPTPANREIPSGDPTVNYQVREALNGKPHFDVIVISGCANDVDFKNFVWPLHNDNRTLNKLTDDYCFTALADLLRYVRDNVDSDTRVVVTTYYPMLSRSSRPPSLQLAYTYFESLLTPKTRNSLKKQTETLAKAGSSDCGWFGACTAEEHSLHFAFRSMCDIIMAAEDAGGITTPTCDRNQDPPYGAAYNSAIASMNDAAMKAMRGKKIQVAIPQIAVEKSAFVPDVHSRDSWVWGARIAGLSLGPSDEPEAFALRNTANCHNDVFCRIASIGHPNRCGEVAYANAIIRVLNIDRSKPLPLATNPHKCAG